MEKMTFFNIIVLYLLQIYEYLSLRHSFHKNCMEPDGNAVFWLLW